jgi:hypothetical protein
MDFRAIQVMCMAVETLVGEITWSPYGPQGLHTPVVSGDEDCHRLEMLEDIMGSLTRMMDTRINYITNEGKIIREWIETILELGTRYQKQLELLQEMENKVRF